MFIRSSLEGKTSRALLLSNPHSHQNTSPSALRKNDFRDTMRNQQVSATATGQYSSIFTVRDEDEATLSCENVRDDQDQCDRTTWIFIGSGSRSTVTLFEHGKIHEEATSKSDRLSLTENCSLVIKKVTVEDVGRYICRQFYRSGRRQGPDAQVELSVVTMTEHEDRDQVTLYCSVRTYDHCIHTVKWLYEGKDVATDDKGLWTSSSSCRASVTFLTSHYIYKSTSKLFSCEVTDGNNRQQFTFSLQSSPEKSGDDSTTTTTTTTTTTATTTTTTTTASPTSDASTKPTGDDTITATIRNSVKPGVTRTATTTSGSLTKPKDWWWFVIVAVGVLVLLMIAIAVFKWKRAKGNKTQMDENTADPEDGVPYASISYSRKTKSKAQVLGKDDEDDAVTYSTVRASPSSAGASADLSNLYAAINNPGK
ncbi:uncharacterized protein LOC127142636 [Lates calcarifer]|uniref:Uncharacterized protein LOC127142636 n=1 Tax=Lates calcarifer TaxID=8187 RepID=A0AAJ8B7Y4_LATCA|nr:uncharacterized protein LOC127142636 [Lates calcarifer]